MRRLWYVVDHVRHRAMWKVLHEMDSSRDTSWQEIVTSRFAGLVTWSQLHVPAYSMISPVASNAGAFDVLALLETLPIVTREDLTNNPAMYTSDTLPNSAHRKSTGGSTGTSLRVLGPATELEFAFCGPG